MEIWHCDAWGYYSGYTTANPGGSAPAESEDGSTANDGTYLRGYQIANANGVVKFETIFPGWYTPRTCHIHLKVHTGGEKEDGTYEGGKVNHTGQLFFPDDVAEETRPGAVRQHTGSYTMLADDMVYDGGGASSGLLTLKAVHKEDPSKGYKGSITLGVDPDAENTGAGGGGGGGTPGGAPADARRPHRSPAERRSDGVRVLVRWAMPSREDEALARAAVAALTGQLALAPKPGLPDPRDLAARVTRRDHCGLRWSAKALAPGLAAMAAAARRTGEPTPRLRAELGAIGPVHRALGGSRRAAGTGGPCGRSACWWRRPPSTPGRGVSRSPRPPSGSPRTPTGAAPRRPSRGSSVSAKYGAAGARGEARAGFPHVRRALDALARRPLRRAQARPRPASTPCSP